MRILKTRFFAFLLLLITGCGQSQQTQTPPATEQQNPPAEKTLDKVSLVLNWFPEVEHGGFYAAQLHGFYKEAGLEVEIIPGGPETPDITRVATGQVDFGVTNADLVLLARAEGMPIVALMAPLQQSPRCIIVHEKSGIQSFEDLKDMTLAMTAKDAFSHYMRKHLPMKNVTIVPYTGSAAQFLVDGKYGQQGYNFSEPYLIKSKGGDPKVLMVYDLGFNPYTSLLIANEKTLVEKADLVKRMTQASVRGWQYYIDHPEETHLHLSKINPEMTADILNFGVAAMRPLVADSTAQKLGIGHQSAERWETLLKQLEETGLLEPGKVQASSAYSTQFMTN